MKKLKLIQYHWLMIGMIFLIGFGAMAASGCAGKTSTSTVSTTTEGLAGGGTNTVTTQKEVTTEAHPRGVIGGLFYTIGQVLLFPFKVIASLF